MFCTFHASHSTEDIYTFSFKDENARAIVFLEVFVKVEEIKYKSDQKLMDLFSVVLESVLNISLADANEENILLPFWEFKDSPVCTFSSSVT